VSGCTKTKLRRWKLAENEGLAKKPLTNFGSRLHFTQASLNSNQNGGFTMQYQHKLILEKVVDTEGPMAIVEFLSQYFVLQSEKTKTGLERFCLLKISKILNKCAELVSKQVGNLREHTPKHRVHDSVHYSPKHAREVFKS
jgi:hypothetical protein